MKLAKIIDGGEAFDNTFYQTDKFIDKYDYNIIINTDWLEVVEVYDDVSDMFEGDMVILKDKEDNHILIDVKGVFFKDNS